MNNQIYFQISESKKLPYLIPIIFVITVFYASFIVHNTIFDGDIIFYLNAGNQILFGDKSNVIIPFAGFGWPIMLAFFDYFVSDVFIVSKVIALICSTSIIFIIFFMTKNVLDRTSGFVAQVLVAINPFFHGEAIITNSEMVPLFLMFLGAYFLTTKNSFKKYSLIGIFLGIAFLFRYQYALILFGIVAYIIISNLDNRKRVSYILYMLGFFMAIAFILFSYNILVHDVLIDINSEFYNDIYSNSRILSDESRSAYVKIKTLGDETSGSGGFLQNYFINLFQLNPHIIFNLTSGINNFSIIPFITFSGIPIFILSSLFLFNLKKTRIELIIPILSILFLTVIFLFYNVILEFYFALFIIPILILGIISIKRIDQKILPFLVVGVIYFIGISILGINNPVDMLTILFSLPILFTVFFTRLIPNSLGKLSFSPKTIKICIIAILLAIILSNLGFSYKLERMFIFQDYEIDSFSDELEKMLEPVNTSKYNEVNAVSNLLSKESDITNKNVMSNMSIIPYKIKSNYIYTNFKESASSNSIEEFLMRDSWSEFDKTLSNINSNPSDRNNLFDPKPDYLIYFQIHDRTSKTPWIIDALESDQSNNFEKIYQSNQTKTVVYRLSNP